MSVARGAGIGRLINQLAGETRCRTLERQGIGGWVLRYFLCTLFTFFLFLFAGTNQPVFN